MSDPDGSPALAVSRADAVLVDHPIDPDWVLEGTPHARISEWVESPDGFASHWTWDCTAGRFRWYFELDESIVVVAGGVSLQVDDEPPVELGVGDAAYFPAGQWVTWTVADYVRKHAVVRVPVPGPLRYVTKGFGRRLHRYPGVVPS